VTSSTPSFTELCAAGKTSDVTRSCEASAPQQSSLKPTRRASLTLLRIGSACLTHRNPLRDKQAPRWAQNVITTRVLCILIWCSCYDNHKLRTLHRACSRWRHSITQSVLMLTHVSSSLVLSCETNISTRHWRRSPEHTFFLTVDFLIFIGLLLCSCVHTLYQWFTFYILDSRHIASDAPRNKTNHTLMLICCNKIQCCKPNYIFTLSISFHTRYTERGWNKMYRSLSDYGICQAASFMNRFSVYRWSSIDTGSIRPRTELA
jgi:hypothetical protein